MSAGEPGPEGGPGGPGADGIGEVFRILVVCSGNMCRSPLAELLLRAKLAAAPSAGADRVLVTSAGTAAVPGAAMDPTAAAEGEAAATQGSSWGSARRPMPPRRRAERSCTLRIAHFATVKRRGARRGRIWSARLWSCTTKRAN